MINIALKVPTANAMAHALMEKITNTADILQNTKMGISGVTLIVSQTTESVMVTIATLTISTTNDCLTLPTKSSSDLTDINLFTKL